MNPTTEQKETIYIAFKPLNMTKEGETYAMELERDEAFNLYLPLKELLIYQ